MKKTLIGVFAAALVMIPATAFAAQTKPAQITPAAVETTAEDSQATDLNDCCIGFTAPCCNVQAAGSCCSR